MSPKETSATWLPFERVASIVPGVNSTTNTTTRDALDDTIREALIEAGFLPAEYASDPDEYDISARDRSILAYYTARRYEAFRIEMADSAAAWTLARWNEDDGISLLAINANGVEVTTARFEYNTLGATWLAALLGSI